MIGCVKGREWPKKDCELVAIDHACLWWYQWWGRKNVNGDCNVFIQIVGLFE